MTTNGTHPPQITLDDRFLALLARLHPTGYGYWWYAHEQTGDKRTVAWPVDQPEPVAPRDGEHVYFGVFPVHQRKHGKQRAKKAFGNVAALTAVYGDFDAKDYIPVSEAEIDAQMDAARAKEPKSTEQTIRNVATELAQVARFNSDRPFWLHNVRTIIDAIPQRPSAVLPTGGGYQAYWLFADAFPLDTEERHTWAVDLLAAWVAYIGADAGVCDISRVLRVPGTVNWKWKYAPDYPTCQVEYVDTSIVYDPFDLDRIAREASRAAERSATAEVRQYTGARSDWHTAVRAAFNTHYTIRAILERNSHERGRYPDRYHRPGTKDDAIKIFDDQYAYAHSCNSPLADGKRHDAFSAFCILEHSDDYDAAICAAATDLGIAPPEAHPAPIERGGWYFHPESNAPLNCGKKALYLADDAGACVYWHKPEDYDQATYKQRYQAWKQAPASTQGGSTSGQAGQAGTAAIDITDENLGRVTDAIWQAMQASAYGPNLYRYGSEIAYRNGGLTTLTADRWRGMVNRVVSFEKTSEGKGTPQVREVLPPVAMIGDSLLFPPDTLPVIERVAPLPVFDAQGTLLTNGYHTRSKTLVETPIVPTPMSPRDALSLIFDDLLVDFPFATQADRANCLAYLLTPFVRDMCGAVPLFLIDAAQRGTGKGLLNDLIHTVWTGGAAPASDLPLNAEEQRKQITTHLKDGAFSIVFDDISQLQGHAIQRVLTGTTWEDRILGGNEKAQLPVRAVFAATGNNVTLCGDMPRRVILIRLESSEEHPSQRTGFKRSEAELRRWARAHRADLVSACLALVQHGLAHGTPGAVTMGGFDEFATVLSTMLNGCGVPGFYHNATATYAREDTRQTGWKAIIWRWWATYADQYITAHTVADLIDNEDDCDIILDGETQKAKDSSAGRLLKAKIGSVFAFDDVRVQIAQTKDSKGKNRYHLVDITPHSDPPDLNRAENTETGKSEISHTKASAPHSPHSPHSDPSADVCACACARTPESNSVSGLCGLCGASPSQCAMSPSPNQSRRTGPATWRNTDHDEPITVIGYLGAYDGRHYYRVDGSTAGIPCDEVIWPDPPPAPDELPAIVAPWIAARNGQHAPSPGTPDEQAAIRAAADANELGLARGDDGSVTCWRVNGTTERLSGYTWASQADLEAWLGVELDVETEVRT